MRVSTLSLLVLAGAAGTFLLYLAAARLGLTLVIKPQGLAVFWPAAGIAAGILLIVDVRLRWFHLGAIAAAVAVANRWDGGTWSSTLVFILANTLEPLAIVVLLRWMGWKRIDLGNLGQVIAFTGAAVAGCALASGLGAGIKVLTGLAPVPFLSFWSLWLVADVVGVITVAPLILMARPMAADPGRSLAEGVAALAALTLAAHLLFARQPPSVETSGEGWLAAFPLLVISPLMLWIAVRAPRPIVGAAPAVLALFTVAGTASGLGLFALPTPLVDSRIYVAQALLVVAALCTHALAAVLGQLRAVQTALRDSERRLSRVLEATTDCVLILDRDWRFTYLNQRAQDRIAPDRPLIGRSLLDSFPDFVDTPAWPAYRQAVATGRPVHVEHYYGRLNGWFSGDAHPTPEGLVVFFRDTTEQRRLAALAQSGDSRLRAVLEQMPIGVSIAAMPTGELIFHNRRAMELLGHGVLPSQGVPDYRRYGAEHPDGSPYRPEEYPLARAVLMATAVDREPMVYRRGDGHVTRFEVSAARINDSDGTPVLAISTFDDVSERMRAAEALSSLNAELEQRVEAGAARLVQLQKMEAIGQLTGGVAHDFNNLLMAILSSLELLRKRLPLGDAMAGQLLDNAVQGAERGATLTQRLLAFARRQELRPESVDVPALVRGMTDLLTLTLGPQVRIVTRLDAGLPRAVVDPNQLEMAILNLTLNARDAMPGGGTLTLTVDRDGPPGPGADAGMAEGVGQEGVGQEGEPYPDRPADGWVRLVVADTGVGMDAATLARAVEPFFTTKGVGRGTGLGLSMVKGLAEQSGGQLLLSSRPGVGTVAEILLPLATRSGTGTDTTPMLPPSAAERGEDPLLRPPRGLRILVVDDDMLVLMGTALILRDLGHTPVEAGSGRAAIDLLARGEVVDLVVTDQAMPVMTGLQLAEALARLHPGLPVIIASGYAELPDGAEALVAGRLTKPFRPAELASVIARTLGPADPPVAADDTI
ncbi:MAG: hypothetical protein RLY86_4198 [Pseudomonadota bacterium]|jgi:signal transduction histidine kinase/integral membrane sensor domain MASE1